MDTLRIQDVCRPYYASQEDIDGADRERASRVRRVPRRGERGMPQAPRPQRRNDASGDRPARPAA